MLSIQLTHFSNVHDPGPTRTVLCQFWCTHGQLLFLVFPCWLLHIRLYSRDTVCITKGQQHCFTSQKTSHNSFVHQKFAADSCSRTVSSLASSAALLSAGQAGSHAHPFQINSLWSVILRMNACIQGLNVWIARREVYRWLFEFWCPHYLFGFCFH